jgi:hypothetical protein
MPCYHPISAYQRASGGSLVFWAAKDAARSLSIACGQCWGCRLERSRQWAVRCMHEASLSDVNCFITLTYDDEHLLSRSLVYSDFQAFMKRLRARFNRVRVRFYMAGEYGDLDGRPHFHALLFGFDFLDKVYFSKSPSGAKLYRSPVLESLWPHGFSSVGALTFESAAYVARYVMKKITGVNASPWNFGLQVDRETGELSGLRVPEFNRMSLKPGVGMPWLKRYYRDVSDAGQVVVNGVEANAPRAYMKWFQSTDLDRYEEMLWTREKEALARAGDNTDDRLLVREQVAIAAASRLVRKL